VTPTQETLFAPTWRQTIAEAIPDRWIAFLEALDIGDAFPFLVSTGALTVDGENLSLDRWLSWFWAFRREDPDSLQPRLTDTSVPVPERLALATADLWLTRLRRVLEYPDVSTIPPDGVLQYFADNLAACVLVEYRRIGSIIEIQHILPIPDPDASLDPLTALTYARTDRDLEILRRALFSQHKVLIHRNTLLHIDRERDAGVFGPTIDTLLLAEYLFQSRFVGQRLAPENRFLFEEVLSRDATARTSAVGTTVLEIGCGNGLVSAVCVKNEGSLKFLSAIDVSAPAIAATYRNLAQKRRYSNKETLSNRLRLTIGRYDLDAVPKRNDLVVCNPPYAPGIPDLTLWPTDRTRATMGTELLEHVVRDAEHLLAPHGEMLIVVSEMAAPVLRAAAGAHLTVAEVLHRDVRFDAGVVNHNKGLLDSLVAQRWLTRAAAPSQREEYYHRVAVHRLTRREN
jgi:methylase of polypeptide subunit release factors